jgi:hypothetical protein
MVSAQRTLRKREIQLCFAARDASAEPDVAAAEIHEASCDMHIGIAWLAALAGEAIVMDRDDTSERLSCINSIGT